MKKAILSLALASCMSTSVFAAEATAIVSGTDANQAVGGKIIFLDTPYGLLIKPVLKNLPAGPHGFHLHQHADCGDTGNHAGGHFDPQNTNSHQGPYGQGHLGDLPLLFISDDGTANTPLLAPRLKVSDLNGLAVMIHGNGDTYSDNPPLGGGGARIACGVIEPN